jgi:hypothetical protein
MIPSQAFSVFTRHWVNSLWSNGEGAAQGVKNYGLTTELCFVLKVGLSFMRVEANVG